MKAAGIICEYNPFHNGHIYHIQQTKAITGCDVLICVMSGNFVQRGEPAIVDKRKRCYAALTHGVDLVLELPFPFATQSAAFFAKGAVRTLALAQVSNIVFGSESNDLYALSKLADLELNQFSDLTKEGMSSAKAYEILYGRQQPNDILAINYIREMKQYGITPKCIKRTNDYHDASLGSEFASATALRNALLQDKDLSRYTPMQIRKDEIHTLDEYYPYLQGLLFSLPREYLASLLLMDEGIEQHFIIHAKQCSTMAEFLAAATTKRYSTSRIRRTLIQLLHQVTKQSIDSLPPLTHLRVLGFNETGRSYLKLLKQQENITIASRINQIPLPYRKLELTSAHMYGLLHPKQKLSEKELQPPLCL